MEKDERVSLAKELSIYIFSFFLVPLGLYWFFKYFKSLDTVKKRVAYISLVITLIALTLTMIVVYGYVQSLKGYINTGYKDLGL